MSIKKQKKISNRLKKKIFILTFLLASLSISLVAVDVQAIEYSGIYGAADGINNGTKIIYRPNVPIDIQVGKYDFSKENTVNGGEFLASYIVGIYSYGAGFASLIAMLMLVIAGWRWLLAGGNAQKIADAKNIIQGVLIGLALLFGGQLLLRQISEGFNSVQSLSIKVPPSKNLSDWEAGECDRLKGDKQKGECQDYGQNSEMCLVDKCGFFKVNKSNPEDGVCVPAERDSNGSPIGTGSCFTCPDRCECKDYTDAYWRSLDPCDCDNDESYSPDTKGVGGCVQNNNEAYFDGDY